MNLKGKLRILVWNSYFELILLTPAFFCPNQSHLEASDHFEDKTFEQNKLTGKTVLTQNLVDTSITTKCFKKSLTIPAKYLFSEEVRYFCHFSQIPSRVCVLTNSNYISTSIYPTMDGLPQKCETFWGLRLLMRARYVITRSFSIGHHSWGLQP